MRLCSLGRCLELVGGVGTSVLNVFWYSVLGLWSLFVLGCRLDAFVVTSRHADKIPLTYHIPGTSKDVVSVRQTKVTYSRRKYQTISLPSTTRPELDVIWLAGWVATLSLICMNLVSRDDLNNLSGYIGAGDDGAEVCSAL
jgi:hypothetical protein